MLNQNDVENIINDDNISSNIDWNKIWSKKYPVLKEYKNKVDINKYATILNSLSKELQENYNLTNQDAMLVLKDILYNEWKKSKNQI